MAELHLKGMLTSQYIGEKKFDGKVQKDENGVAKIERAVQVLDLESDRTDIFKIKFTQDQELIIKKNLRNNCMIVATVGTFNKYTFYNLLSITAL